MTPDELAAYGRLLFGDQWERGLASVFGTDEGFFRQWVASGKPLNCFGAGEIMIDMLGEKARQIKKAIEVLSNTGRLT